MPTPTIQEVLTADQAYAAGNAMRHRYDVRHRVDLVLLAEDDGSPATLHKVHEFTLEAARAHLRPAVVLLDKDVRRVKYWPAGVPVYLFRPTQEVERKALERKVLGLVPDEVRRQLQWVPDPNLIPDWKGSRSLGFALKAD